MFIVSKEFSADNLIHKIGEILTGKGFRLLAKLIKLGYMKECDTSRTLKTFDCELCKRKFVSKDHLDVHYITVHPNEVEIVEEEGVKNNE